MTFRSVVECDGCPATEYTDPGEGTPAGWYLVALMDSPGCWDDKNERHFCPDCGTLWRRDR